MHFKYVYAVHSYLSDVPQLIVIERPLTSEKEGPTQYSPKISHRYRI